MSFPFQHKTLFCHHIINQHFTLSVRCKTFCKLERRKRNCKNNFPLKSSRFYGIFSLVVTSARYAWKRCVSAGDSRTWFEAWRWTNSIVPRNRKHAPIFPTSIRICSETVKIECLSKSICCVCGCETGAKLHSSSILAHFVITFQLISSALGFCLETTLMCCAVKAYLLQLRLKLKFA